ncbi:MAG: ABC transporter substrate-binding protein [Planctomycetota bacterium]
MRIVSLLPAATQVVRLLGLESALVGVSHECETDGGAVVLTEARVPVGLGAAETDRRVRELLGRGEALFELDEAGLRELRPDVVIAQSLCAVCAVDGRQVAWACVDLGGTRTMEWSPTTLGGVINGVGEVGRLAGAADAGERAVGELWRRIGTLPKPTCRRRVVFLEWLDPLFAAGHWVPELVAAAGGEELLGRPGEKSGVVTLEQVRQADPDVIVTASCGWTAQQTRAALEELTQQDDWASLRAVRDGEVWVADAWAHFTTPGPSLVEAAEGLADAFAGRESVLLSRL